MGQALILDFILLRQSQVSFVVGDEAYFFIMCDCGTAALGGVERRVADPAVGGWATMKASADAKRLR